MIHQFFINKKIIIDRKTNIQDDRLHMKTKSGEK